MSMQISASQVKELRERTGAGMMDCKKALLESGGDIEAAIEHLRKTGAAKAAKKAGRIAAEGAIVLATSEDGRAAVLVEVNSETDFVAKDENFARFAQAVADTALASGAADVAALAGETLAGDTRTVEAARTELVAKVGENVTVRRLVRIETSDGIIGSYLHGRRIGVLVELEGGTPELARDIAMHVAASRPLCVDEQQMPAEVLDKEREILTAQAADSGKPPEIVEKMVAGRLQKFLAENTLLGQPFVRDPERSVGSLLDEAGARVRRFERLELGEGVEKKSDDFAAEVMSQVRGSR